MTEEVWTFQRPRDGLPHPFDVFWYWTEPEQRHLLPELNERIQYVGIGEPCCFGCHWMPAIDEEPPRRRRNETEEDHSRRACHAYWRRATGKKGLEFAHLVDHCRGGTETVDNIVLLCHECHRRMPSFGDVSRALVWVRSREDWCAQLLREGERLARLNRPGEIPHV